MIIWINGSYGSGKTQTAYELQRRLDNSYVYDPENIGYFLDKNLPTEFFKISQGNFQNYELWRNFNYEMISYIASNYDGILIIPMTIINKQYYDQIIGNLEKKFDVKHFILSIDKETNLKRLAKRFDNKNPWFIEQIELSEKAFQNDIPGIKLKTDNLSITEVAELIAKHANLQLIEDKRTSFQKKLDRIKIQIKHIH